MITQLTQENRDFDKEMGKTYICPSCGEKFKMKFQDSDYCLACRGNIHAEIQKRLQTKIIHGNYEKIND